MPYPTRARDAHRVLRGLGATAGALAVAGGLAQACSSNDVSSGGATADAGSIDEAPAIDRSPPPEAAAPRGHDRLSQTGLYADIATKTIAADVRPYEPDFVLWSDGADKKRWVRIPAGTTIDTTDPDHWILPVGAQLWKEFSLDGKRLETRLVERVGSSGKAEADYWIGAFAWREDESDADFVEHGALDVRGTPHDIPAAQTCWACHLGEPGHALGFSALQLSHTKAGVNLGELRSAGLVPPSLADRPAPGDAVTRSAMGYLHANCGHCHNPNGVSWPDTDIVLRLGYGESDVTKTSIFTTSVGVPVRSFVNKGFSVRIDPGSPDTSAVAFRMSTRDDGGAAMPPLATEIVDPGGIAAVRTWIGSLDGGTD